MSRSRALLIAAALLVAAAVSAIYLPYVGVGLKQDDFAWIVDGSARGRPAAA